MAYADMINPDGTVKNMRMIIDVLTDIRDEILVKHKQVSRFRSWDHTRKELAREHLAMQEVALLTAINSLKASLQSLREAI